MGMLMAPVFNRSFREKDMLALAVDLEAGLLQGLDRPEMVYARKLGPGLSGCHFHFANSAAQIRLPVKLQVTFNRIVDVFHRLRYGGALGMASRQLWTTD